MSTAAYRETFDKKFATVKKNIINHCRKCITDNWEKMFDMWLSCEAHWEFGNGFRSIFEQEFGNYMTSEIKDSLWLAGKHILFAVSAFMSYKEHAKLDDLLNFTEKFVSRQLDEDDFDNWCGEISTAMYEETSEYERENTGNSN